MEAGLAWRVDGKAGPRGRAGRAPARREATVRRAPRRAARAPGHLRQATWATRLQGGEREGEGEGQLCASQ